MMKSAEYIKTKTIEWLLSGGLGFSQKTDAVGAEVLFSQNKRKADLLIMGKFFHALEIKGDADNLSKLVWQIPDYQKAFDFVSVVVTGKHLKRVYDRLPKSVGVILFDDDQLILKRPPVFRKRLDKRALLMFLDKQKMIDTFSVRQPFRGSTEQLRLGIANRTLLSEIRKKAYSIVKDRHLRLFRLFLSDTNGNFVWDELKGLCGKVKNLSN